MNFFEIININNSVLLENKADTFMTSLDIVQKVMNVPMCALASLLRANGYNSIDNTASLCIDEKRLEIFADAYVRKIRSYFISSLRNISNLDQTELKNFKEFSNLFKKQDLSREPSKWSDIDIEHLKQAFIENVKRKTPKKSDFISYLGNLASLLTVSTKRFEPGRIKKEVSSLQISAVSTNVLEEYISNNRSQLYQISSYENEFEIEKEDLITREIQNLDTVTHSFCYVARSTYVKQERHINYHVRNIYIAARYHIFSYSSDDDDNDTNIFTR